MVFRKALRIYGLKIKHSLMSRMAYPLNFFLMIGGVFTQAMINIIFIKVIYIYVPNISGWNQGQALTVVATYLIIEGMIWATTAYVAGVRNNVRTGTLDCELVKPMDTQFLVSIWRIDPEDFMRIIVALYLLFIGLQDFHFSILEWAGRFSIYSLLIINGYVIFYSILVALNTIYFWAIESGSLSIIFENIIRMSQYPSDIFFHKTVRLFFSTIIPLAFLATVPAKALTFGFDLKLLVSSTALAIFLFVLSRKLWLFALGHYSSASS